MKLKILKDFKYAFDHIHATDFKEGEEFEPGLIVGLDTATLMEFYEVVIAAGLAEDITPKEPQPKPAPKENKMIDNKPSENKGKRKTTRRKK